MADLSLILDPTSEDATNVQLELVSDSGGYRLVEQSYPAPAPAVTYSSSADSEGEQRVSQRYTNRKISLKVEVFGTTAASVRSRLNALEQKVAKIGREGGTLKKTWPDGVALVFDLITYEGYDPVMDVAYYVGNHAQVSLEFAARPFARGAEVTATAATESTLPVITYGTSLTVAGDAPALGRLVVTDAQGVNQRWVTWGIQRDSYDPASTAGLFYEAEGRTVQGGGNIVTQTGASGGGSNNATETTLLTTDAAILSTQASGGGAHLTHRGTYRVFARVLTPFTNTGQVTWSLEWGTGDFRVFSRNDEVVFPVDIWDDTFRIIDLGLVTLPKVQIGAQRWEGRIIARSSVAGDAARVDCLWLLPIERSGEAASLDLVAAPGVYAAYDMFNQSSGNATGKSLPTGGTYTGAGDSDDFTIDATNHRLQRTATSDAATSLATGRILTASGTANLTDVQMFTSMTAGPANGGIMGMVARYVDVNNFLAFVFDSGASAVKVIKRLAGVETTLSSVSTSLGLTPSMQLKVTSGGGYTAQFTTTASGDTIIDPVVMTGIDVVLDSGGALDDGYAGLYDRHTSATAGTRSFDYLTVAGVPPDAVVFASQSIEWRYDGVLREDSAGSFYAAPSKYEGDYLTLLPYGQEAKPLRVLVKASRGVPGDSADSAIDDITVQLIYTPRYLVVPG